MVPRIRPCGITQTTPDFFIGPLRAAGLETTLLTLQEAKHIHDVTLKTGSKKRFETVAPGYEHEVMIYRC